MSEARIDPSASAASFGSVIITDWCQKCRSNFFNHTPFGATGKPIAPSRTGGLRGSGTLKNIILLHA
jgi:hypothetical protein